jgi:hypothetical protein
MTFVTPVGLLSQQDRDIAAGMNYQLEQAIVSERWDQANDLSNELEAFVVKVAGVNEDNILSLPLSFSVHCQIRD